MAPPLLMLLPPPRLACVVPAGPPFFPSPRPWRLLSAILDCRSSLHFPLHRRSLMLRPLFMMPPYQGVTRLVTVVLLLQLLLPLQLTRVAIP